MESVADVAANLSSEAAKGAFEEGQQFVRYVSTYEQNIDKFNEKLKSLTAKRKSVQQEVDDAERSGKKIKADVEHWCKRVDEEINEREKKVKDLEGKAKKKCFFGLCPNFNSRYQCSLTAEEGARTFDDLIKQSQFNKVGYLDVPEAIVDESPNGFETFKSREKVFNDIMEAMKDVTVSMIGVYGLPGVGKTLLVNEVARQVQEVKLFDSVVTVTVAQTPVIQKIQENIAELLSLRLKDNSINVRARRLHERLKKEKTVLIVLDDIWKRLDLKEVGIPFGNQHKGCKILLTSRDRDVLLDGMKAEKTFAIDVLDNEETWNLFKKMAGDSVERAELRSIAIEVAKKCARLPLAIATVANALSNKPLYVWKDALLQLQKPCSRNLSRKFADAYLATQLSYNHLENEELKQAFLLCSLLRRVGNIDDLLKYAIGLGLINGVDTMEEARSRLLTMVRDLKASCLLIDNNTGKLSFDMHDLVYDFAMSIASKDHHLFASHEEDVPKDWPNEETMKKCNMINLEFPSIRELPDELNCPQLVFCCMFGKDDSLEMPPNFFRQTTNLKVLGLTEKQVSSLPSSICLLTSLRTLCLDYCKLGDIAIIGELKNLEILSLLGSHFRILPKEIGRLVKLKLLDLRYCAALKIIPAGFFSTLSRLEELYMLGTFIQWEVREHANQRSSASLAELKNLSCLIALELNILDVEAMSRGLFFEEFQKLERYKILIGSYHADKCFLDAGEYSRTLILNASSLDHLGHGLKMFLKKTEALRIYGDFNIKNDSMIRFIIRDNGAVEFPQLRSLIFQGLPDLIGFCCKDLIAFSFGPSRQLMPLISAQMLLPCLETLQLSSTNIERIWHNSCYNLEKLTTLIIKDCDNLTHLLSFSLARRLVHLKCFEVSRCKSLKEIISKEEFEKKSEVKTLFPKLASLSLENLQHLIRFCPKHQNIEFPSLKSLKIENCPKLKGFIYKSTSEGRRCFSCKALFDEKVAFPSLEEIFISNLRSIEMIWQNQLSANSFLKLQRMQVIQCNNLLTIFSSNTLRAFQGLQTLQVYRCDLVEEVFEIERSNMEETRAATTHLKELVLGHLPSLKYIWKNDPQGIFTFENLQVIDVRWCLNLKNVFPASVAKVLPQLRCLSIHDCGVEEIVSMEEGLETTVTFEFNQVSFLSLWKLLELKCFYAGVHTTKWPMLKEFNVYGCGKTKILGTKHFSIVDTPNVNRQQLESQLISLDGKQAWSLDDLPTTVVLTMHQGSMVTSMDFHPSRHTLLLVGSANGEITLWELGMRQRLVTKPFKIWKVSTWGVTVGSIKFQVMTMFGDILLSVNRVTWSPDGSFVGVAFSKHLIHLYAYPGSNDLIQIIQIDAHVGGVNDLAFAHINKRLCVVTCGDDDLIKVWDPMTGQKLFNFEGHDAPVYSICPYQKQNIPLIYSTTVDGTITSSMYDGMQYKADFFAPGQGCSTIILSANSTRLFSCGTSKDGRSFLVEWYRNERIVKRIYEGFTKKSAGVVSFDIVQNQFLAAGEDSQIKFWNMDDSNLLTFIDAEGGLPSLPRVRFNKEGNLLAVTTADNGFKILANAVGLRSLRANEASSSSA
ncbi:PREDICTED: probable disease resistance protein At4g27220 isoform X1 [Theobroma cacao]|uniref:Probable disease resistance protein At4g27220 isoform X1 n=1 Tax=Theobroma cacao TaxID=3641 RepID=A0AB32V6S0_THECC|nr:PREDICTED: probable disease resistance protein At4g27220 isoform X1 [Theobroma cacao]